MQIQIQYCQRWNYEPRALRARDRLRDKGIEDVELLAGGTGAFEIIVEGRVGFSKIASGRFPTDDEIDGLATD